MQQHNFRFSAPDWCFFRDSIPAETYYRKLFELGYTGAEMVAPERWQAAKDVGLELVNACSDGMADGFNVRANHGKLLDSALRQVEALSAAGVKNLIVFSGNRVDGVGDEEAIENCREAFSRLLGEIRGSGVALQFEMLNARDHAGYQADNEAFGFRLARMLDDPDFSLCYDIYHMAVSGGDLLDGLEEKLPWIAHFHVAALHGRTFPGEDNGIDYPAILRALASNRYDGYVGMEFIASDPLPELERAIALFRGYR
ncbi:MAG: TIM barrel protein [Kiritimatiellia bacterium]|jgi:hydroxypyruvate isomerase